MTDANLKAALERITELEAELEAEEIRVDLLLESLNEREDEIRALKGQLNLLRVDRRYEIA